ncbi:hypothetical protein SAMN02910264_01514 [Ruminococcaceae bacterium YAD3003]|nr:hypothetical protein SAMN02910264_01514 [Ruminococcaceae bacterium YAD3003]
MPDRKSFMIDMENRIDRIQQTINELGFGTTEREFQVGLRVFYEYGLCATQCVKFASDKTFCEFVEALNNEIQCYKDNKNSDVWHGLGVRNDVKNRLLFNDNPELFDEIIARKTARFVLLSCENISSNTEFSYIRNTKLGLYELTITMLQTLDFESKNEWEELADSLAETLDSLQFEEDF